MRRAAVLVGGMSRIMREIVEDAIGSQPDMQVVGQFEKDDLAESIQHHAPDVVITKEDIASRELRARLLSAYPCLKLLVFSADERLVTLFEVRRSRIADPSPTTLIATIREALAASPE